MALKGTPPSQSLEASQEKRVTRNLADSSKSVNSEKTAEAVLGAERRRMNAETQDKRLGELEAGKIIKQLNANSEVASILSGEDSRTKMGDVIRVDFRPPAGGGMPEGDGSNPLVTYGIGACGIGLIIFGGVTLNFALAIAGVVITLVAVAGKLLQR